jgi:hypothetical protein
VTLTDPSSLVSRGMTSGGGYVTQITPEGAGWADAQIDPRLPLTTAGGRI